VYSINYACECVCTTSSTKHGMEVYLSTETCQIVRRATTELTQVGVVNGCSIGLFVHDGFLP
jgi:hypothetical protein